METPSAVVRRSRAPGRPDVSKPRRPSPEQRQALLDWLDDGLREGRRGRLLAEYPTALAGPDAGEHQLMQAGGRFASHALSRVVQVRAGGLELPLGMIGLVYTDPARRGARLASRVVEAAVREIAPRAPLVALWSDRHALYGHLGFRPAGCEVQLLLDREVGRRARRRLPGPYAVDEPRPADWPSLERLYAGKPSGCLRAPGDLARLARSPDCRVVLARSGERAVAYAALGRGDDFPEVIHEWAGDPGGVVACIEALLDAREPLRLLAGPAAEAPLATLLAAGAKGATGCFALVRVLDPARIWDAVARDEPALADVRLRGDAAGARLESHAGTLPLGPDAVLQLLLSRTPPAEIRRHDPDLWRRLLRCSAVPWPLFVWGFDSI